MSGLAIAHPLYQVIAETDHKAFLIAHDVKSIDLWLLVLVLSFITPLVAALVLLLANLISPRLALGLYIGAVFILALAGLIPIVNRLLPERGFLQELLPLVGAIGTLWLYARKPFSRTFVTLMSPIILLAPLLFLTGGSIRSHLVLSFISKSNYEDFHQSPHSSRRLPKFRISSHGCSDSRKP